MAGDRRGPATIPSGNLSRPQRPHLYNKFSWYLLLCFRAGRESSCYQPGPALRLFSTRFCFLNNNKKIFTLCSMPFIDITISMFPTFVSLCSLENSFVGQEGADSNLLLIKNIKSVGFKTLWSSAQWVRSQEQKVLPVLDIVVTVLIKISSFT